MAGNSFGKQFVLTSFGESHGTAIGGVLDGCPSGIKLDIERIQKELDARRPGQNKFTSPRKEDDQIEFLSGIFEGKTLGTPIAFIIRNRDHQSSDYESVKELYRPSHADFTYHQKYGIYDYRGGGRASARETAVRVAAGAIARQFLEAYSINVLAWTKQIASISIEEKEIRPERALVYASDLRCPDLIAEKQMKQLLENCLEEGDAVGGVVHCSIKNLPAGLGEPVFDKLNAGLAAALMSINAAKGVLFGAGLDFALRPASEMNDAWILRNGQASTETNHSGGIQAGISNGMEVSVDVVFKAPSSIRKAQNTLNHKEEAVQLEIEGRHDPCVVPRAVSVVEAMCLLTIADYFLLNGKQ